MKAMNMNKQSSTSKLSGPLCINEEPLRVYAGQMNTGDILGGQMYGKYSQHGADYATNQLLSGIADGSLVLSDDAIAGLVYMVEEEKMARDLYDAFAEQTGSLIFDRIPDSEQKHYDTLLEVAEKAGIDLTGISTTAGIFSDPEIQNLYDSLYAQGSVSLVAALEVGILVENTDIADLSAYSADSTLGVVSTIYANLTAGSEHHLAAFTQQSALIA